MYGRGACDMKSGVAAFVAAAVDFVREDASLRRGDHHHHRRREGEGKMHRGDP